MLQIVTVHMSHWRTTSSKTFIKVHHSNNNFISFLFFFKFFMTFSLYFFYVQCNQHEYVPRMSFFFSLVLLIFFFLHSVFAHSKEQREASKNEKKTYKNKLSFTRMLKQKNKSMEINWLMANRRSVLVLTFLRKRFFPCLSKKNKFSLLVSDVLAKKNICDW